MEDGYITRHLSRKAEDYLEAILNVTLEKGYARTKDVAHELGISPSSVVEMFRKLDAMHLVCYRRYEGVVFLPEGQKIAEVIKYRHDTLKKFLLLIAVPEDIADADACFMEHELHPETVRRIHHFIDCMENNPAFCQQIQHHQKTPVR
ncbi:metal-dependent transcriptional regulator [Methanogenium sp. MK-MG]|uniref:metal-dependent transcriptional regulator n=1 Tax=Methanogenium sp. MK-MG TaxID=2599926 RepID=UPI0013ED7626|nr:iron dependent repressor, metal binding and dimerization domain protein [Methanogenium sp. MK-MG]